MGGSYAPGDGYIDPPRNVLAYTAALFTAGVQVVEHTAFTGLRLAGSRVAGVSTTSGGDRHRAGRADRRPDAGRGRPGGRRAGSRPAARGTRSW